MQNFLETSRRDPEKIDVAERLQNFEEIYRFFNNRQVRKQAERCVQCGDPFCTTIGCPLQNHIPQWLEAIAARDLERAFLLSNESSPFPEILGRVCPQGILCEGACTLNDGHGAITIGAIEASITDLAFNAGLQLPYPGIRHEPKVAVIGSGPAGISCAHFLLRAGIGVDMYERAERPGGLLTYGIPGFKLDKGLIDRRFKLLRKAGLDLHLQQEIGETLELETLQEKYAAIFVGIGATKGKRAGIKGEELPEVIPAMEYLTCKQHQIFGAEVDARYNLRDKRVVVIGGGDTAMDCLRTAMRDGAESVSCLYRRDMANMPGSRKEYHNAVEEGVEFRFNLSPREIRIKNHRLGIEVEKTQLGEADEDGRQRVEIIPGSRRWITADVVIPALGFEPEGLPGLLDAGVECDQRGRVKIDPASGVTSNPKIYAGGDCYRGADLVVTAAADGRRAALAMMQKLLNRVSGLPAGV
ncbi:MAG: glutamate synthase subunit beta [Deltaproteobacteria bacterium]|nr:glutamate synthase subunit beta [Deltaproteobacteria bacterium]